MVTTGAGVIGSNSIRYVLGRPDVTGRVVNYDKLTHAGNLMNLSGIAEKHAGTRYVLEQGDICDYDNLTRVLDNTT